MKIIEKQLYLVYNKKEHFRLTFPIYHLLTKCRQLRINKKGENEMFENLFDDYDLDDELDNTIILDDEKGNPVSFEFLDLVEYESNEYVVLLPKDDSGEVVILLVKDEENSDEESYTSVDDEKTLNDVFELFKEKHKDEYNFED